MKNYTVEDINIMKDNIEISLNDKTEIKINGMKIPNLLKLDIKRDAEEIGTTSLKLEFYVLNSELTFN